MRADRSDGFVHFAFLVIALALIVGALAGCAKPGTLVKERIERVSVPVAVGCVAGERPADVPPLNSRFTADQWAALTHKQKTAEVAAQALRHQSHAQALGAATGACR